MNRNLNMSNSSDTDDSPCSENSRYRQMRQIPSNYTPTQLNTQFQNLPRYENSQNFTSLPFPHNFSQTPHNQPQYTRGDQGAPTIILEAVASQDLWIWHAYFGLSGARNDINVLNESPLFNDALHGHAPDVLYTINGNEYTKGYYLTDGIYPEWASFVKSFQCPADEKRKKFKQRQEAARKDIERAFGVLQARWAIVSGPARGWYKEDLGQIMLTCIILHNMIIEDEGENAVNWQREDGEPEDEWFEGAPPDFQQYLHRRSQIRDKQSHHRLRNDLIEHIWNEPNRQE
ncbi:hypothetical protein CASFOL_040102 [Castilleja foliolosa]|uniref:Protein ALP1-like n=1 Tax=Castilleja foliolosa TaxID=1961234 RepID=A0ABD3BEJ1_9LAMI